MIFGLWADSLRQAVVLRYIGSRTGVPDDEGRTRALTVGISHSSSTRCRTTSATSGWSIS